MLPLDHEDSQYSSYSLDKDFIILILKFADDTKLFGKVGRAELLESMHEDIELLSKWSKTWRLKFF